MRKTATDGTDRFIALENNECPDCGSENGYWRRGHVADFEYTCEDCRGIFDQDTAERVAQKLDCSATLAQTHGE